MKAQDITRFVCGMTIAAAFALSPAAYSAANADAGKAVFNKSCIHCHGAAGTGNPVQDEFWQIKIPRLNGEYIQSKSDDELRDVILNGRRKMPPAVQGEPHSGAAVKVRPEQVPDLIAYIRSFKKK